MLSPLNGGILSQHCSLATHIMVLQCSNDNDTHSLYRQLMMDVPVRGVMGMLCCCCWKRPRALVTVHLEDAHDLKKQDITGAGQNTLLYHHTYTTVTLPSYYCYYIIPSYYCYYTIILLLLYYTIICILLLLYHHTTVTVPSILLLLYPAYYCYSTHHTTVTILYHHNMHILLSSYYCYCTQHTTVTIRSYTLLYPVTIPSYYPIFSGADPYCIVKCGRKKVKTPVIKNTLNPTFSSKVNFYISNPATTEVTVQVK